MEEAGEGEVGDGREKRGMGPALSHLADFSNVVR